MQLHVMESQGKQKKFFKDKPFSSLSIGLLAVGKVQLLYCLFPQGKPVSFPDFQGEKIRLKINLPQCLNHRLSHRVVGEPGCEVIYWLQFPTLVIIFLFCKDFGLGHLEYPIFLDNPPPQDITPAHL